jgi:uncharacterized protein YdeI (YjbR/CyaY-like superfamily)
MANDLPIIEFASEQDWHTWLQKEHANSPGAWLKIAKKDSGKTTVTYDEALRAALCFGWIDGQKGRFDEVYWLQRFTPRRKNSKWSKRNRGIAEELLRQGKIQSVGLQEIEAARAEGGCV